MVPVVVGIGNDAHQHAVMRIVEIEFRLTALDLDDIDGLHVATLHLLDVLHLPRCIFACFESALHGGRERLEENFGLGHVPHAGGIEPCVGLVAGIVEIGHQIGTAALPIHAGGTGELRRKGRLHLRRHLHVVIVASLQGAEQRERQHPNRCFFHHIHSFKL